jgi:fucose permease
MTATEQARDGARRRVLVVASLAFLAAGISQASLGPALPDLAESIGVDLAALGALFTALYGGALVGQLLTGAIVDRVGHRPVIIAGPILAGVGVLGVSIAPSLAVALAASLLSGLGYGALFVGANLVVADAYEDGGAGALNLTNLFYGVGAIVGPALVGVLLGAGLSAIPALWVAAATMALTAVAASTLRPTRSEPRRERHPAGAATPAGPTAIMLVATPITWVFGLILLLYVGNEGSIGAWLATYLGETAGTPLETGALATSGFWLALTAGRLVAAAASPRLGAPTLLLASLCGALAGGIGLVLGVGSAPLTVAAAILLGLSFGPIYPTTIALVTVRFPAGTGTVTGIVMTLGSLGGAVLPWLTGVLILQVSPLAGIVLVPVSVAAMLGLWLLARHLGWRPATAPVPI